MFNNMVEGQYLSIDSTEYDVSASQITLNSGEIVKKAEFIKGDNKVEVSFWTKWSFLFFGKTRMRHKNNTARLIINSS